MPVRALISNFNFHTSLGGSQATLLDALEALRDIADIEILDPYCLDSFRGLAEGRGFSIRCLGPIPRHRQLYAGPGAIARLTELRRALRLIPTMVRLWQHWRRTRPTVIYCNQTKSAIAALLFGPGDATYVYHCHDPLARGHATLHRLSKRLSIVIANSEYTREVLLSVGWPPGKVRIVENGVDKASIRDSADQTAQPPLPCRRGTPVFLLPHAAYAEAKGSILAVSAFGDYVEAGGPGELWVAGLPPSSGTMAESKHLGRIQFLGYRRDLPAVMREVDVVLVPTPSGESFGRVAFEALTLGKPVVAARRGHIPRRVSEKDGVLFFEPSRPSEFVSLLWRLSKDGALRARLGAGARTFAEQSLGMTDFRAGIQRAFSLVLPGDGGSE